MATILNASVPDSLVFGLSQASDMMNAILEGYPKSKKEFLVRTRISEERLLRLRVLMKYLWCPQDEVGVETDEDCKVVVPSS